MSKSLESNRMVVQEEQPAWLSRGHVPSLDGLRAVAILLVIFSHLAPTKGFFWPHEWLSISARGGIGVDIFFVLSGFLITLLLLREMNRTGTLSLKYFYLRRVLRIFPAYYTYLFVMAVLCLIGWLYIRDIDWRGALTYTINFHSDWTWEIAHFWSLSVEEHFYLIWPAMLLLLGVRQAKIFLVITIFAASVFRLAIWHYFRAWVDIDFFTLARMDTLAIGCLLAFLAHEPTFRRASRRLGNWLPWVGTAAGALLVLSITCFSRSGKYTIVAAYTVHATLIAVILWVCINSPQTLIGRVLNSKAMVFIGALSYSLYLWQQPFLNAKNENAPWICRWPYNTAGLTLAALGSYYLIERPFLRIKDSLHPSTVSTAAAPAFSTETKLENTAVS